MRPCRTLSRRTMLPPKTRGLLLKAGLMFLFESVDILTEGKAGMTMDNYFFTNPEGVEANVEYIHLVTF